MTEQFSQGTGEKPTFSTLNEEEKRNQEPWDVEIINEEKFGPSTAIDNYEPVVHEAELMTEEATANLHKARAKEDAEMLRQDEAAEALRQRTTKTIGDTAVGITVEDYLFATKHSPNSMTAERPRIEKFPKTAESIKTALLFLQNKYDTSRMRFERILKGDDLSSEIDNLSTIRATLTEEYKKALEEGQEFTPEMAMAFYEEKYNRNLKARGDDYDAMLSDRYYTVKRLFKTEPRALKAFMSLSAEEIMNNEAIANNTAA